MEHKIYEKTGERVSLLGYGNMRLPTLDGGMGEVDYNAAKPLIDRAYAAGVNYFDTAWVYHGGTSETFLGKALADYDRASYFLATKLPVFQLKSQDQAREIFAKQLEKCNTGYFDFYLMHSLSADHFKIMKNLGLYEMMDAERKAGKIRKLGFSFHDTPEVLAEICDAYAWDFAQIQLNYLDWDFQRAKDMVDILNKRGIPFIVMEPVRGGRLADLGPEANALLKAANPSASIASWALRWVASIPGVLCVLSGMSTLEQVEDNLATFSTLQPLSESERSALDEAIQLLRKRLSVPCTKCSYCMPCPSGVDIPGMIEVINEHAFDHSTFGLREDYPDIPKEHNAGNCVACGQCESVCPQHLPISQLMSKMHADATG